RFGSKQTFRIAYDMSTSKSRHRQYNSPCLLRAKSGHSQKSGHICKTETIYRAEFAGLQRHVNLTVQSLDCIVKTDIRQYCLEQRGAKSLTGRLGDRRTISLLPFQL